MNSETSFILSNMDVPKCFVEDIKIILKSINIPKTGSFWTRISFYIIVTNTIVMQVAHTAHMVYYIKNVEKMASTCSTVTTTFQGIFKMISLYINSSRIKEMFTIIRHNFWPTYIARNELRTSIDSTVNRIKILTVSYTSLIMFCCFLLVVPPLLMGVRELPLASLFPFDWTQSPVYEILYVWQWIVKLYGVCHVVSTYDMLFISVTINLIMQFRILQDVLVQIGTEAEMELNKTISNCSGVETSRIYLKQEDKLLVKCVKHHMKLLKFADILEKTFSPIIFSQFVESVSGLCLGVFLINLVEGVNLLKLVFFVIGHLAQFLVYCLIGNEIMYQSVKVADAAFTCEWHVKNCRSLRQGLMLIIQRAQRSKKITALGMADLNIISFIEVVRSSTSISALLKTMMENGK